VAAALRWGARPATLTAAHTDWRRALIATPGNGALRVPTVKSIVTYAGDGSWRTAVEHAALDPAELARRRAARLPHLEPVPATVADRLDALDESQLAALGLTRTQARKLRGPKARAALALTAAVTLARALGGSLDWLAGLSEEAGGASRGDLALDVARVKALREQHALSEKVLREAAGLTLGDSRRLMAGSREPTVQQRRGAHAAARAHLRARAG
jgi:hypothetical protein